MWKQQISGQSTDQSKIKRTFFEQASDSLGPLSAELCVANANHFRDNEIIKFFGSLFKNIKPTITDGNY